MIIIVHNIIIIILSAVRSLVLPYAHHPWYGLCGKFIIVICDFLSNQNHIFHILFRSQVSFWLMIFIIIIIMIIDILMIVFTRLVLCRQWQQLSAIHFLTWRKSSLQRYFIWMSFWWWQWQFLRTTNNMETNVIVSDDAEDLWSYDEMIILWWT